LVTLIVRAVYPARPPNFSLPISKNLRHMTAIIAFSTAHVKTSSNLYYPLSLLLRFVGRIWSLLPSFFGGSPKSRFRDVALETKIDFWTKKIKTLGPVCSLKLKAPQCHLNCAGINQFRFIAYLLCTLKSLKVLCFIYWQKIYIHKRWRCKFWNTYITYIHICLKT
jgi:hypothetical protein